MARKLTDPIELWNANIDGDEMRVYMRHSEDCSEVQLMVRFSFEPEFGDLLVGLAGMVDELLVVGNDPFLIHKAEKDKVQ